MSQNALVTYWDLKRSERAKLTEDQLDGFRRIELMKAGKCLPSEPELVDVPDKPEVKTTAWYQLGHSGPLFQSMADVEDATGRYTIRSLGNDWDSGLKYVVEKDAEVLIVDCATKADIEIYREAFLKHKQANEINKRVLKEYSDAMKDVQATVQSMFDDYQSCRDEAARAAKIVATFEEFCNLANGDEKMALVFLQKQHSRHDIETAFEYLDKPSPFIFEQLADDVFDDQAVEA